MGDRRNPYVILGVPFGASDSEARSGFARASRRLRQGENARYGMEDLTWALLQIEQIIEEPRRAFDVYRIPANPDAAVLRGEGIFAPVPRPLDRRTPAATGAEVAAVRSRAGREIILEAITESLITFDMPEPYTEGREI